MDSDIIDIPPAMDRKHISAPGHILVTRPMMVTQSAECHSSSRAASSVPRSTYKDILRYIFDSEKCQIDLKESRSLREVVNKLCTTENEEFLTYFEMIEDNVQVIKEKKPKLLFKEMYKYSSSTLSTYLKGMPQDAIYNRPILWQVRNVIYYYRVIVHIVHG